MTRPVVGQKLDPTRRADSATQRCIPVPKQGSRSLRSRRSQTNALEHKSSVPARQTLQSLSQFVPSFRSLAPIAACRKHAALQDPGADIGPCQSALFFSASSFSAPRRHLAASSLSSCLPCFNAPSLLLLVSLRLLAFLSSILSCSQAINALNPSSTCAHLRQPLLQPAISSSI